MNPQLAPTPRRTIFRMGTARLYRFSPQSADRLPVLIVPSMINRWYIVDLRAGASLVDSIRTEAPTYCLDWGVPNDEDRYLSWDKVVRRLQRAIRKTLRDSGRDRLVLLGYCMGGTLASIAAALNPSVIAGLVNLAGPIDFKRAGELARSVDKKWFDADAIASAGNMPATLMQSGFTMMRPTLNLAKWAGLPKTMSDRESWTAFSALEKWAADNVPFPADAYRTYIGELYQDNALFEGRHHVGGRRVDLGQIRCPVLTIAASRDTICPKGAAVALNEAVGSSRTEVLEIKGGHVGAVVGRGAQQTLYPGLRSWLERLEEPVVRPVVEHVVS